MTNQHNTETEGETWEACGPFGEREDTWSVEVLGPHGGIVCETYDEGFAKEIAGDHNARLSLERQIATAVKALEAALYDLESMMHTTSRGKVERALEELKGHREVKP